MDVINTIGLTKDYGNNKGIFNVNIQVKEGEVFGFLGPNGAGKSTTIRHLMGFIRPDSGSCNILGMDCFTKAGEIHKQLGYLAGEIAFIDDMSGKQLLNFIADMKNMTNRNRMNELIDRFELDARGKVKRMSKGMKQKIGIISAFMNDPSVIILDEPTSGLDPLMQSRFVELILEEKKRGKTIFMSSHIFEEVEKTCDRTAIIRNGEIVAIENMEDLAKKKKKTYVVSFEDADQVKKIKNQNVNIKEEEGNTLTFEVEGDIGEFLHNIGTYKIKDFDVKKQTLEEIFMHYYGREEK